MSLRDLLTRLRPEPAGPPVIRERRRHAQPGGPLRVAVIGTGRIATAHLAVLRALPTAEVVAVANRGGTPREDVAQRLGVSAALVFDEAERMLDHAAPEAVWVLVDVANTPRVASSVLARGLPCLVEKPAAPSATACEALAEEAARAEVVTMVGLNRRYLSVLDHALDAVRARGPLRGIAVEAHEPIANLRAAGTDPWLLDRWMLANTVHWIDLFRRCGGEVEAVDTIREAGRDGRTTSWVSTLRFDRGALGTFTAHWASAPGWRITLYGDDVRAEVDGFTRGTVTETGAARRALAVDEVDLAFKPGFYAQAAAFVDAVRDGTRPPAPASDIADQVATMRLAEAIAGPETPA